jgi:hypothetical protein
VSQRWVVIFVFLVGLGFELRAHPFLSHPSLIFIENLIR